MAFAYISSIQNYSLNNRINGVVSVISPAFIAGGQGGNTLAYSADCITWTSMGAFTFTTSCNKIAYNG